MTDPIVFNEIGKFDINLANIRKKKVQLKFRELQTTKPII